MIKALLILSIFIWPFGQTLSYTVPGLSFSLYLLDISTIFLLFSLIVSRQRKKFFDTPLLKPLIIFWLVVGASLLINYQNVLCSGPLTTLFYALRLFIYPSVYFAVRYIGISKIKKYLQISIAIFSFLCLFQYTLMPDMRFLKNLGFDDHYYRLIGPFYDPNFTGAIFCGLALYGIAKKKYIPSIAFIILLALTFSRASYLAFIVGLIYLLFKQRKFLMLASIPVLGLIILLIPKPFGEGVNLARTFSIFSRLESWRHGLDLFIQKPLFGWGYNTLRSADGARFQIDNSFIFLLATTGIIGLVSFAEIIVKGFRSLSTPAKAVLLSLLTHAFFNNSLFYIWLSFSFWLTLSFVSKNTKE